MNTLFFVIFFGIAMVVGLWAIACLVLAVVKHGPAAVLKGFFMAVTGRGGSQEK